jgi:hypothetical protein
MAGCTRRRRGKRGVRARTQASRNCPHGSVSRAGSSNLVWYLPSAALVFSEQWRQLHVCDVMFCLLHRWESGTSMKPALSLFTLRQARAYSLRAQARFRELPLRSRAVLTKHQRTAFVGKRKQIQVHSAATDVAGKPRCSKRLVK